MEEQLWGGARGWSAQTGTYRQPLYPCESHPTGSDGGAQDCCLKYSQRKIPHKMVRGYRKQEPSIGCAISAIL